MSQKTETETTRRQRPLVVRIGRWLGGTLLLGLCDLIGLMSPCALRRLAGGLVWLLQLLPRRQQARIRENLRLCLGDELPPQELHRIARGVLPSALWGLFLTMRCRRSSPEELRRLVELRGKEHLDEALAQGRGVVAIGAHLGPFPLLGMRMGAEGYPYSVMIREASDRRLGEELDRIVSGFGVGIHYRGANERAVFYALRRGGVVHLFMDQHASEGGAVVEFFGHPMPAFTGPSVLARLLGCPVVPMFLVPAGRCRWAVEIGPPFDLAWSDDRDADVLRATQLFLSAIEEAVRRHRDQWSWTNSCWVRPWDRPRLAMPHLVDQLLEEVRAALGGEEAELGGEAVAVPGEPGWAGDVREPDPRPPAPPGPCAQRED